MILVVAIFAKSASSTASPTAATEPTAAATMKPPIDDEPLEVTKQVVLAVEPMDAHVFVGDKDLGASPVVIDVKDGSKAEVEIRRDGYKIEKIVLDGSEAKKQVRLERSTGGGRLAHGAGKPGGTADTQPVAQPQPSQPKPKPKPQLGGGEIVNPWGN